MTGFAVCTEDRKPGAVSYALAPGTQVRAERFGLLFFRKYGPRLFFLSSGEWISPDFFTSDKSLSEWTSRRRVPEKILHDLENALARLAAKGVLSVSAGRA